MQRGFTLIELIIVIAIITIIAAVTIPSVVAFLDAGRISKAHGVCSQVHAAINSMMKDTGQSPFGYSIYKPNSTYTAQSDINGSQMGLVVKPPNPRDKNWKGPYMPRIGNDPWGNPYYLDWYYPYDSLGKKNLRGVVILSYGPDGVRRSDSTDSDDVVFHLSANQ